jgi:hypothetical protein
VLREQPADDGVGDRAGVHAVLATTDLFLYLRDSHVPVSLRYRLPDTDQLRG